MRKKINEIFGAGFIDPLHEHVRLHNSINSYIDFRGKKVESMKCRINIDELFNLSAEDLIIKSRHLACKAIKS